MSILLEQHPRPSDLAKLTGLSADTIRDLFKDQPGALVIDRPEKMHKRGYSSMRIPTSVAARVLDRYRRKPVALKRAA
jgi:hypothetical protein